MHASVFAAMGLLPLSSVSSLPSTNDIKIDPAFAENITVYHVNPHEYGWNPLSMNTGDAAGDVFFDMHNVWLDRIECQHAGPSSHGCDNPEATAPNLVVNKLVLTVDDRFSGYARCNIGVNGSDGHGHQCETGTYCCFCEGPGRGSTIPCNKTVGRENVKNHFGSESYPCGANSPPYECWRTNLQDKFTNSTPGWWYSTLKEESCDVNPSDCTWKSSLVKIVDKKCADEVLWSEVKKYDTTGCFSKCPGPFNTSSICQIECFFTSVLGPNAGHQGGTVSGMPLPELLAAFDKPFNDISDGGCPALSPKITTKHQGSRKIYLN